MVCRSRGAVLDRGTARAGPMSEANALGLACALRLAAKHHRNAESVIIMLKEHWYSVQGSLSGDIRNPVDFSRSFPMSSPVRIAIM